MTAPTFDIRAFLRPREAPAAPTTRDERLERIDVDAMLRGTRNVARASICGVTVGVRPCSAFELARIDENVTALLEVLEATDDAELRDELTERHTLAAAILDPAALARGERAPLFTPEELAMLSTAARESAIAAFVRVRDLAFPAFESESDAQRFVDRLQGAAREDHGARARARQCRAHEFFGVPLVQLTDWQAAYFAFLTT